jgi:hypothetical protein
MSTAEQDELTTRIAEMKASVAEREADGETATDFQVRTISRYEAELKRANGSVGAPLLFKASEKQKTFIRALLAERAGNWEAEDIRASLNEARLSGTLTLEAASEAIVSLLKIPKAGTAQGAVDAKVPEGRYALSAGDGHFVFYRVACPTTGSWAGHVFVSQLLGSAGNWDEQRLSRKVTSVVLARIAADPEEAARTFGLKASACGRCGSPLSNTRSRAAGYGEICAGKQGFFYPSENEAREILDERAA